MPLGRGAALRRLYQLCFVLEAQVPSRPIHWRKGLSFDIDRSEWCLLQSLSSGMNGLGRRVIGFPQSERFSSSSYSTGQKLESSREEQDKQDKLKEASHSTKLKDEQSAVKEQDRLKEEIFKKNLELCMNNRQGENPSGNSLTTKDNADDLETFAYFADKLRRGQKLSQKEILDFAKLAMHTDDVIRSLDRSCLLKLCKSLEINLSDPADYLIFKLRRQLIVIEESDKKMRSVGINSLTDEDLKLACIQRGYLGTLSQDQMRLKLQAWLDITAGDAVSPFILIILRALATDMTTSSESGDTNELFPPQIFELAKLQESLDVHNSLLMRIAKAAEKATPDEELDPFLGAKLVDELVQIFPWIEDETKKELKVIATLFQNRSVRAAIKTLLGILAILMIPLRKVLLKEDFLFIVSTCVFLIFFKMMW